MIFNGDFNFLNAEPSWWRDVNEAVARHTATAGNVEVEAVSDGSAGCGCGYPAYVADGVVERSNAIVAALRETAVAAAAPELREWLGALPRTLVLEVGDERRRVGVVHGDVDSLAGWSLAVEAMEPADAALRDALGCAAAPLTPAARVRGWCDEADVGAICSTHTCLPFGQILRNGDEELALFNNGAAGMPNFAGDLRPGDARERDVARAMEDSLYGAFSAACASTPCPSASTSARGCGGSTRAGRRAAAAHESYFGRITHGPAFAVEQAARPGVEILKAGKVASVQSAARERQGELLLTARYVNNFYNAPGLRRLPPPRRRRGRRGRLVGVVQPRDDDGDVVGLEAAALRLDGEPARELLRPHLAGELGEELADVGRRHVVGQPVGAHDHVLPGLELWLAVTPALTLSESVPRDASWYGIPSRWSFGRLRVTRPCRRRP